MKKRTWWWLGCTLVAVVLSFIQWRYPLPTGTENVEIAGAVIVVVALAISVSLSYLTLVIVAAAMVLTNLSNWWTVLPILVSLVVLSFILRWQTSLDTHMEHSQAINLGLIAALCQLVTMIVVVGVQTVLMTNQWDEFKSVVSLSLPAALLNALLDCLIIPPLTLFVRHYTELKIKKDNQ